MDLTRRLNGKPVDERGACVLYWMQASQRAEDNPALNEAIRRANAAGVNVLAFFGLDAGYPGANARHFAFMLDGLRETEADLEAAGIPFVLQLGQPDLEVVAMAREVRAREVVVDGAVLRHGRGWRERAAGRLPVALTEVASETVVPVEAFGRLAATAAILRPFLHGALDAVEWDQRRPPVEHPCPARSLPRVRLAETAADALLDQIGADRTVPPVRRFEPGYRAALRALDRFVAERLEGYPEDRNRAERAGTSELSPYLHFGQVSPHTIVRAVRAADARPEAVDAFVEQLIVRRELSWNLCRYNPDYDRYKGLPDWGRRSLEAHAADPRPVLYARQDLEAGETHDPVWNAAQREMAATGYMHNTMRMVWAKKILEWSETPEEAFATAVALNDKYELDGRDPNSYAGIGWAIGGRHDRPWPQRPIFGCIRYMSTDAARRKMDMPAYLRRVGILSQEEGA